MWCWSRQGCGIGEAACFDCNSHQPYNLHLQEGLVPEGMVTRRTLNWALGIMLSRVIMLQDKVGGNAAG